MNKTIFSWQTQKVKSFWCFPKRFQEILFHHQSCPFDDTREVRLLWKIARGEDFSQLFSFWNSIKLVFIRQNQPQVATDVVYRSSNHLRLTVNFIREQTIWLKSLGAWIVGTRNYPHRDKITKQWENGCKHFLLEFVSYTYRWELIRVKMYFQTEMTASRASLQHSKMLSRMTSPRSRPQTFSLPDFGRSRQIFQSEKKTAQWLRSTTACF